MSYIRLNLTDHDRTISGEVHGSIGDAVIASLSAEPETIHELQMALGRFVRPTEDLSAIAPLRSGENFEPYDAGIVIVDLAARVVAVDSTYSAPPTPMTDSGMDDMVEQLDLEGDQSFLLQSEDEGIVNAGSRLTRNEPPTYGIAYHDGEKRTDVWLPYRITEDWIFVGSVHEYEWICRERREERAAGEWFDPRPVLFGKQLSEFVAREILTAPNLDVEDLVTSIHAKWLVSPRADLHGESPRELLLAKQEHIDFDLHSRELQWSFTGECPPALLANAQAFRCAGFGTHEIVLYYDLIRVLLDECYKRAVAEKDVSLAVETERLEEIKSAWLETPNRDCQGKAPALIIEWERKRIPLVMSGKAAMVDEDCPVCQAMAEDLESPFFWHLDGCHMDEQFEFSYFKTREEWEADQRRREDFDREFDRKWKERKGRISIDEASVVAGEDGPLH